MSLRRVALASNRPEERGLAPQLAAQPLAARDALVHAAARHRPGVLAVAVEDLRHRAELPLAGDPPPQVVVLVRPVVGPVAARALERLAAEDDRAVRERVAEEQAPPKRRVVRREHVRAEHAPRLVD